MNSFFKFSSYTSIALVLLLVGCKNRYSEPVEIEVLAEKSSSINLDTNKIETERDFVVVNLKGESGDRVFINDKEAGVIPQSGELPVTIKLKDVGDYNFSIHSQNSNGTKSKSYTLSVTKKEKSADLGTISTKGPAEKLTVSQNGVIFIAEKGKGLEIIKIGYTDEIKTDLLAIVSDVNAQDVFLSNDESILYVKDEHGKFHAYDITTIGEPQELTLTDTIEEKKSVLNSDKTTEYVVRSCGLESKDITNPNNPQREFVIKDKEIKDVVLTKDDKYMLLANGTKGLTLYDISDKKEPKFLADKVLGGTITGLSLLKKDGVLFVANGEHGVEIFDLKALIRDMLKSF